MRIVDRGFPLKMRKIVQHAFGSLIQRCVASGRCNRSTKGPGLAMVVATNPDLGFLRRPPRFLSAPQASKWAFIVGAAMAWSKKPTEM
jgi:hypothetical protein